MSRRLRFACSPPAPRPGDGFAALFAASFAAAAGPAEGARIGALVSDLLASVAAEDLLVVSAEEAGSQVGGVVFSRMRYPRDPRRVFILSPAAVAAGRQGRGIGLAMIRRGLAALRRCGVDVVLTYGDPGFYTRAGFDRINEAEAPAPLHLTQPEGWLGRPLRGRGFRPLAGPAQCAAALDDPDLW